MLTPACTKPMASSMAMPCIDMSSENAFSSFALANWKCPLSVSIPPMSISATSLGISIPAVSMRSLTISQQDERPSSQKNSSTSSHLPVGLWWSTTMSAWNPSTGHSCSGEEVSTTTMRSNPSPNPSRTAVSVFAATIFDTRSSPSGANMAHPGKHLAMA